MASGRALAGIGAVVAATFLWSTNIFFGKLLLENVAPFTLSFLRQISTVAAALPLMAWAGVPAWRAARERWVLLAVIGLTGFAIPHTLIYVALRHATAINVAILNSLVPALVVAIGVVAFGLKARPALLAGIAVSGAGALVIVSGGDPGRLADFAFGTGEMLGLAAMVCAALYTALSGALAREVPGAAIAAVGAVAGAVVLAPLAAWEVASGLPMTFDGPTVVGVAYVGIFPSAVAMVAWSVAIRRLGPERASQGVHLIPVFTAALAVAALGERVMAYHLLAVALIVAGIWIARRAGGRT